MATPNIILQKPLALIQPSSSISGIETVDSPLLFGTIAIINELSDMWAVNDTVIFNPDKGDILRYDGIDFYLIDEKYIYSQEQLVP